MTTNSDDTPPAGVPRERWKELQHYGEGVTVMMAGRVVHNTDFLRKAHERDVWAEKLKHIPSLVHHLTGPDSGIPAEMERWESWHLEYVTKLAEDLTYLATTAASIIARRDGVV